MTLMSWIITLISTIEESLLMDLIGAFVSGSIKKPKRAIRDNCGQASKPTEKIDTNDDEDIWFDGVDKRLIDIHCKKKNLTVGNNKSLTTKINQISPSPNTNFKRGPPKRSGLDPQIPPSTRDNKTVNYTAITKEVALDCEMVECNYNRSVLARVSIVNLYGHPLMDRYVAPTSKVTDYRTKYSGIRKADLMGAPSFEEVQSEVNEMLKGKIIVGHALHNDFRVLKLQYPTEKIRDTSKYFKPLFQGQTPSLKKLSECILGVTVQVGEHDSIQDAQAAMKLYVKYRDEWNQATRSQKEASIVNKAKNAKKQKSKKKVKTFIVTNSTDKETITKHKELESLPWYRKVHGLP